MFSSFVVGSTNIEAPSPHPHSQDLYKFIITLLNDLDDYDLSVDLGFYY
jgi:hypothetical protein